MAKAGLWAVTDAEERKRGERTGLDTLVVLSLIHISEPTRLRRISYAVFCLKKKRDEHIAVVITRVDVSAQ